MRILRKRSRIFIQLSWKSKKKTKLKSSNYLDLNIKMENSKHEDKRDNFDFHITRMPYKSSNIPHFPQYHIFLNNACKNFLDM